MSEPEQSDDERPFSPEERAHLRSLLHKQAITDALWAGVRSVAVWVSAVLLAVTVGYDALKKVIKALLGQP